MVEGTQPTASTGHAVIVRETPNETGRKEIPVNLTAVIRGKTEDPILQANDIVFLPTNSMKAALKSLGVGGVIGLVTLMIAYAHP